MTDRRGVLMLMFDLPMQSSGDRREYTRFKTMIREEGFLSFQESCYIKLLRNISSAELDMDRIRRNLPKNGLIHVLPMSLNRFKSMQCLLGQAYNTEVFSDDLVFLGENDSNAIDE